MIKIVCDRCGNTITDDQEIGYIAWNFRESIGGDLIHENEFEKNHYCPDCMDKIHAFISGGETALQKAASNPTSTDQATNPPIPTEPPKKPRRKVDIGKIMALREAGWTYPKIADEMEMSSAAVAQAVYTYKKKRERSEEA